MLAFEERGRLDYLGKNLFINQQQIKLNPYLMQSLGIEPSFFGGMQALPQLYPTFFFFFFFKRNLACLLKSKLTIVLYFASFVKINNDFVSYLSVSTQFGISIKCCFQTC